MRAARAVQYLGSTSDPTKEEVVGDSEANAIQTRPQRARYEIA